MLTAAEMTVQAMAYIVQMVPIGTNVNLVRVLWCMVNGSFLQSRGALIPALYANGLSIQEVRRCWAAVRSGAWDINELLDYWQLYVASENQWHERRHEGYQVLSIDITGFWRPHLKGWKSKHYHNLARRALPAVVVGVMVISGQVKEQRIPLLRRIVRLKKGMDKPEFRLHLLKEAAKQMMPDQVAVVDAEFTVAELQAAEVLQYVVRLATNCTARRNELPPYKGKGRRPEYGEYVRPLPRTWKEREIAATKPERTTCFEQDGVRIRASSWDNLVTSDQKVDAEAATYSIHVFHDPRYKKPLVLATDLDIKPETALNIYQDRWPVEQAPLAAKQMIGLHRQFVFAPKACFRLPELSLLAGSILTYCAAVLPPVPSGFWDRTPKPTPGRLRRLLGRADLPTLTEIDPLLRKKDVVTAHLPKGVDGHRRQKQAA